MKIKSLKLRVGKETVRALGTAELSQVGGGATQTCPGLSAACTQKQTICNPCGAMPTSYTGC